jgi:glucokinase-like ROK family protein
MLEPVEAAVIAAIRREGPLSRTDLTTWLDYSRASVTSIVGRMVSANILTEVGEGKSAGGRRPTLLDINPGLGYVIGVDIGATSVDLALADFHGVVVQRESEAADVRVAPEPFLTRVADLIDGLLARQGLTADQVVGIGVGVPGPVEFETGLLIAPPLMPLWEGYPIRDFLRGRFRSARVAVDNDVNLMAKGEQQAGAGKGIENFLFIKIGTGIGCGIIAHNAVYRGSDGTAGDIGHICVDYNGPFCHCGNQGCLEIMAAGPAIAALATARAEAGESDFLAERLAERGHLTAADVGEAAATGDRAANEIIRRSGQMIGGTLAGLVNFYNPRAVFLGGGVSNIGHGLLSSVRQATLRRATSLSTRQLRIEYSQLGADAGVIGAVWLALEQVFAVK